MLSSRHRYALTVIAGAIGFFALGAIPALAAGIVYNSLYDCGPGRSQFKVLSCDGTSCKLYYAYKGGNGGFTSMTPQQPLLNTINGTSGYPPCKVNGKAVVAGPNAVAKPAPAKFAPAKPAPPIAGGAMAMGHYECFTMGAGLRSAMMENFTLSAGGRYLDAGGHSGTYTVAGGVITFQGAALGGQRGQYEPGVVGSDNPPHVQFIGARGSGDKCDGHG
jgi:hypothetical protein